MIRISIWTCMFAVFAALSGCKKSETTQAKPELEDFLPKRAQPKLQTMKLWLGAEELTAELALTEQQQMTGMMFRTNMTENEAMLFIHPENRQASYWMMHCPLPLSIVYISPDGVIQEIHNLQPNNTNAIVSASVNIRFALETSQGWFQRHNISAGTVVRTEHGSLMETFFRSER